MVNMSIYVYCSEKGDSSFKPLKLVKCAIEIPEDQLPPTGNKLFINPRLTLEYILGNRCIFILYLYV